MGWFLGIVIFYIGLVFGFLLALFLRALPSNEDNFF